MLSWYMGGVDFGLCIVNPNFEAFHTCDLRVLLRYPSTIVWKRSEEHWRLGLSPGRSDVHVLD